MGLHTDIEWCDSTLNLMMGCDGCELWNEKVGVRRCYAGHLTELRGGRPGWPALFTKPEIYAERLEPALRWGDLTGLLRSEKPWLDGFPRLIFLNDMGDTFTRSLEWNWLAPRLEAMAAAPHCFLILTKAAARMRDFFRLYGVPRNFWLGVSITADRTRHRLEELNGIPGDFVRFVSYEPALGPVRWELDGLDWVIAGGESGPDAQPSYPDWFRTLRDACQAQRVAFFFKQWGEWVPVNPERAEGAQVAVPMVQAADASIDASGEFDLAGADLAFRRFEGTGTIMRRTGKRAAGRRLDGELWSQMPRRARPPQRALWGEAETATSAGEREG